MSRVSNTVLERKTPTFIGRPAAITGLWVARKAETTASRGGQCKF